MKQDINTVIEHMGLALNTAGISAHETNKIASLLLTPDGKVFAHPNYRPRDIEGLFPEDQAKKIGNSSQFIHSEVACIARAPFKTDGTNIFITDPPCPNCAKAIVEAGINRVYIDSGGLEKDFFERRGEEFQNLSLLIFERAGIDVYILNREERKLDHIAYSNVQTRPKNHAGIEIFDWDDDKTLSDYLKEFRRRLHSEPFCIAKISQGDDTVTGLLVQESYPPGITPRSSKELSGITGKYRFEESPMNRLTLFLRRHGYTLADTSIACNLHPSSRDLVNAVGFGMVTDIILGEQTPDHDKDALNAAQYLGQFINIATTQMATASPKCNKI